VLSVIKGLGRGGAELLLAAQIHERDRRHFSYEVAYLTPEKNALVEELESAGVAVTCLDARSSADPRWIPKLRKLLLDREIDVVHAHSPVAASSTRVTLRTIRRRRRPRMVTTEHNLWQSHTRLTRMADSVTAGGDDARIAVSSAVRDSLPGRLQPRTEVIRHGVDVPAIAAQANSRNEVREELGLQDQLVVGTVANLRVTKGWPDLLAAAKEVTDTVKGVTFVAVGQGPMEAEIMNLHRHLKLGDRFRMLGYRDDAVRVMAGCDLFCLASHHEGLPVAVMEAMALGLPIVATDVGGVAELVADRIHGRLVPPHRPDLLAAALVDLLTNEIRRTRAAAAVLDKAESLSARRSIQRTEEIYETLACQ
jgi:glycosyltransferase involved in cell wall biosynthesis